MSGESAFVTACAAQDMPAIEAMNEITDVNVGLTYSGTFGNIEMMVLLQKKGATDYDTSMFYAVKNRHSKYVIACKSMGATKFDEAMEHCNDDDMDMIETLLTLGAKFTPRLSMSHAMRIESWQSMYDHMTFHKKNPLYKDTMLGLAAAGKADFLMYVHACYSTDLKRSCAKIEKADMNTLLQYSCHGGRLDLVTYFMGFGADDFDSALIAAVKHIDIVKHMIMFGAKSMNQAFAAACTAGAKDTMSQLAVNGATTCATCNQPLYMHGLVPVTPLIVMSRDPVAEVKTEKKPRGKGKKKAEASPLTGFVPPQVQSFVPSQAIVPPAAQQFVPPQAPQFPVPQQFQAPPQVQPPMVQQQFVAPQAPQFPAPQPIVQQAMPQLPPATAPQMFAPAQLPMTAAPMVVAPQTAPVQKISLDGMAPAMSFPMLPQ